MTAPPADSQMTRGDLLMTNEGSHTPMDRTRDEGPGGGDDVSSLVHLAACKPPYDTVRWDALAERIVAGAQDELARRRVGARLPGGTSLRRGVRAWWEVTAGWARPAVAAAVAMIAVAAALVIATPGAPLSASGGDTTTATTLAAGTDAIDAMMLETPNAAVSVEPSPPTRDSLFSALVDAQ